MFGVWSEGLTGSGRGLDFDGFGRGAPHAVARRCRQKTPRELYQHMDGTGREPPFPGSTRQQKVQSGGLPRAYSPFRRRKGIRIGSLVPRSRTLDPGHQTLNPLHPPKYPKPQLPKKSTPRKRSAPRPPTGTSLMPEPLFPKPQTRRKRCKSTPRKDQTRAPRRVPPHAHVQADRAARDDDVLRIKVLEEVGKVLGDQEVVVACEDEPVGVLSNRGGVGRGSGP